MTSSRLAVTPCCALPTCSPATSSWPRTWSRSRWRSRPPTGRRSGCSAAAEAYVRRTMYREQVSLWRRRRLTELPSVTVPEPEAVLRRPRRRGGPARPAAGADAAGTPAAGGGGPALLRGPHRAAGRRPARDLGRHGEEPGPQGARPSPRELRGPGTGRRRRSRDEHLRGSPRRRAARLVGRRRPRVDCSAASSRASRSRGAPAGSSSSPPPRHRRGRRRGLPGVAAGSTVRGVVDPVQHPPKVFRISGLDVGRPRPGVDGGHPHDRTRWDRRTPRTWSWRAAAGSWRSRRPGLSMPRIRSSLAVHGGVLVRKILGDGRPGVRPGRPRVRAGAARWRTPMALYRRPVCRRRHRRRVHRTRCAPRRPRRRFAATVLRRLVTPARTSVIEHGSSARPVRSGPVGWSPDGDLLAVHDGPSIVVVDGTGRRERHVARSARLVNGVAVVVSRRPRSFWSTTGQVRGSRRARPTGPRSTVLRHTAQRRCGRWAGPARASCGSAARRAPRSCSPATSPRGTAGPGCASTSVLPGSRG